MKLPHLRSEQIKTQPDQTSALINKIIDRVNDPNLGGGGGGGTSDFNQLTNRPSYAGTTMTGSTNIPAVPTKTSQLNNDSGFVNTTDLTNAISNHNTSSTAHSDIRNSITSLSNSVTAIQNVIPTAATANNKLTDKNYVDDSINSVTAYYITKNAQGDPFATKAELTSATVFYSGGQVRIPTRNDYCIVVADESQRDPITGEDPTTRYIYNNGWEFQYVVNKTALTADQLAALNSGVTAADVTKLSGIEAGAEVNVQSDWTEADNTSDAYIKNKPTIGDATLTITQNGTSVGTFTANATSDVTLALTDTLYNDFTGATNITAGAHGLVIAPAAGDQMKALYGDGTWKLAHMTIAAYGKTTYAEILAAYQANNIIYCRASSNSNPGTGNQLRMAFLAYVNNEATPTEFEFQYYRSVSTHTDSQQGDQVFVYKINSAGTWSVTVREAYTKVKAGTNMTSSYSSGAITLSATVPTKTSELLNDGSDGTSTYVEADDYATNADAGVIKVTSAFGAEMSGSGELKSRIYAYTDYPTMWNDAFVSKGTLENAITGKGLVSSSSLAAVATSGSYSDLINKPNIPTIFLTNTVVASDTPTGWVTVLGGDGIYYIEYNTLGNFTNQPTQFGLLEVSIWGNEVDQVWHEHADGDIYKRSGNVNGWKGDPNNAGAFDVVINTNLTNIVSHSMLENNQYYDMLVPIYGTEITSSSDLNTRAFLDVGMYYTLTDTVTQTLTNCPTTEAITMRVYVPFGNTVKDPDNDTWVFLLREITTHTGKVYTQMVNSDTTPGTFTYGAWVRKLDSTQVKSLNTQSHANWPYDNDKIPDMSFMSFWNGAYDSNGGSNLTYFAANSVTTANIQGGAVTSSKLNDFLTQNTTDTWVPVATGNDNLQHRVIKPFNADGSVPTTALGFDVPTMNALNSCNGDSWYWKKLGHITLDVHSQGQFVYLKIFIGYGNNGRTDQNAYIDLIGQLGWTGDTLVGRYGWNAVLHPLGSPFNTSNVNMKVISSDNLNYDIWIMIGTSYCRPNVMFFPTFNDDGTLSQNTHFTASFDNWQNGEPSGTACNLLIQQAAV